LSSKGRESAQEHLLINNTNTASNDSVSSSAAAEEAISQSPPASPVRSGRSSSGIVVFAVPRLCTSSINININSINHTTTL